MQLPTIRRAHAQRCVCNSGSRTLVPLMTFSTPGRLKCAARRVSDVRLVKRHFDLHFNSHPSTLECRNATVIGTFQGRSHGIEPCTAAPAETQKSARLSHARRTSGCPTPNSPACSPRRQLGQVFRALFPACDVSSRIVHPSYAGLRPRNNGDS